MKFFKKVNAFNQQNEWKFFLLYNFSYKRTNLREFIWNWKKSYQNLIHKKSIDDKQLIRVAFN